MATSNQSVIERYSQIFLGTSSPTDLLQSVWDHRKAILDQILVSTLVYLLVCIILYKLVFKWRATKFPDQLRRVLLVTAHPDDECMFFGPTLLSLCRRKNCEVYVLCLSNGNYDKKGHLRRTELWSSCKVLGLRPENVILYNVTDLQDDPTVEWKVDKVAGIIRKYVESLQIEALISFDQDGVSHHANHCQIYYAIASLFFAKIIKEADCQFFALDSVNVFRKYLLLFDLPVTLLLSTNWFVLHWSDFRTARIAMKQHRSQLLWFRYLYIFTSRYMLINSLRQITVSDIELDLQL